MKSIEKETLQGEQNQKEKSNDVFLYQIESSISQDKFTINKNLQKINDLEVINKRYGEELINDIHKNIKIWKAEKETLIYNISQDVLTNLTYKNCFDSEWKYDLIKNLLCNILKNTFNLVDSDRANEDITFRANICKEKIFELFKKECFMSAKIKNYLLDIDNFRIEIDGSYNVYRENSEYHYGKFVEYLNLKDNKNRQKEITNSNTISKTLEYFFYITDLIYKNHSNEISKKEKEFIGLWIPLLDTIRMIIQLSVANERLKDKENKIHTVNL